MTSVKLPEQKSCILCGGTGEVLEKKARQMGYTIAPSEPSDVLEEKLVSCPLCEPQDKCELCGNDASQLEAKTVRVEVEVKCCPQCALDWDAVKLLEKTERKQSLRELSYRWADGLHGQRVIVYWDDNTHPRLTTRYERCVRGTAYRISNECGGWGNVKVIIEPAEHGRISLIWTYSIEYATGKHCPYQKPIIDGQKYGLYLNPDSDGSYYTLVSWGCRKSLSSIDAEIMGNRS